MENKITVIPNGPFVVEGTFSLKGVNGELIPHSGKTYLCKCGKSKNKPHCDGAHKK